MQQPIQQQRPPYPPAPAPYYQQPLPVAPGKPKKFNRNWYYLALLGPVGWFAVTIIMAAWEPLPWWRNGARVILAGLVILWIIGFIAMAANGKL
jgi:hypothetical protein